MTQPRAQLQLSSGWQQKIILQNHTLQAKMWKGLSDLYCGMLVHVDVLKVPHLV